MHTVRTLVYHNQKSIEFDLLLTGAKKKIALLLQNILQTKLLFKRHCSKFALKEYKMFVFLQFYVRLGTLLIFFFTFMGGGLHQGNLKTSPSQLV